MRIALGVEYDGSQFFGWQSQAGGHTVQDALQAALSGIANEPVLIIAAGRTDTGVHALEQVVHFDAPVERPLSAWVRGVNALLPKSIAVLWAHPVPDEFHARFSAQARSYRYLLVNRPVRCAVQHGKAGWFHTPLDVDRMCEAAQYLLGEHDFSAFRAAECQAKSPVKTLHRAHIERRGDFLLCDFYANAFLHHMIRNIMGGLVQVGAGKHPPEWMQTILEGRDRSLAAATFDAAGLYLAYIRYPSVFGLPESSERWLYA